MPSPQWEETDGKIAQALRKTNGLTSAEIAEKTGLSIGTVRIHLDVLMSYRSVERKTRWLGHHSHTYVYFLTFPKKEG